MGLRFRDARVPIIPPRPEPEIGIDVHIRSDRVQMKADGWWLVSIDENGFICRPDAMRCDAGFPIDADGRVQLHPNDPAAIALREVEKLRKAYAVLHKAYHVAKGVGWAIPTMESALTEATEIMEGKI